MARSRFEPQPQAGMRLEERDRKLLTDLFQHRLMSRSQIQTLYFGSPQRCNARLRQLFDFGFVTRYYLPAAPFGAQAIYSIGKSAVPIVAKAVDMPLADVAKEQRRSRTPTFIEHTLEIVNVYLAFKKAVTPLPIIDLEWLPESLCRHEYVVHAVGSQRHHKEIFKPDAFVRLSQNKIDCHHNYFLEVDLGHTSSQQFIGKLLLHQRYLESGLFKEIFGCDEFKTLVVTTSEKRLKNLLSLVEQQGSSLFWFTTFCEVQQTGVLRSIWRVPFQMERTGLLLRK
ncbi:MAG TPA: replication-relaxation family protein [Abditibacteriaceae bacterium]|jgi:hypothetical protein